MSTISRDDRGPVKRTIGDDSNVPCPSCGKLMCIQDITTDGCLKPGFVDQCEHCEAEFEIDDVEYSATVWVKPATVEQASKPPPEASEESK